MVTRGCTWLEDVLPEYQRLGREDLLLGPLRVQVLLQVPEVDFVRQLCLQLLPPGPLHQQVPQPGQLPCTSCLCYHLCRKGDGSAQVANSLSGSNDVLSPSFSYVHS